MANVNYEYIETGTGVPVKAWTKGVLFEEEARKQVQLMASMPFIHKHIAIMPDVHAGKGSTVGSVIPTKGAVIPATCGVDIGCGMCAVRTSLKAKDLPDSLSALRSIIEKNIPVGRTDNGGKGDRGAWGNPPSSVISAWHGMVTEFEEILGKHPKIMRRAGDDSPVRQLCSLGGGNHFIEVCLDTEDNVWIMLHSGSRGAGNKIGTYFINLAKEEMKRFHINLLDQDLAYLSEGTTHFDDYIQGVSWAQNYALKNRELMMERVLASLREAGLPAFKARMEAVNCHHNYISRENHFGEDVLVTRKGAVRAAAGVMGIIPGSMGAKSFIVRGLGNPDSFDSCSHGAGRTMSRTAAKKLFTLEDHIAATAGIECRKDEDVIDETPACYKSIDDVMTAQKDLVEIVYTLKQVVCVKG